MKPTTTWDRASRPLVRMRYAANAACVLLSLALSLPVVGQASKKGEKTAETLMKLAEDVEAGDKQVGVATTVLHQLANQGNPDLRKPFKQYQKAVDKLGDIAKDARKRRDEMQAHRSAYFLEWDLELAKIQNEDIHARSADRRQKVQQDLEALSRRVSVVDNSLESFEKLLRDIETALGTDLSSDGVQAVRPAVNTSNQKAVELRGQLGDLRAQLQSLGVAMSAKTPKPSRRK